MAAGQWWGAVWTDPTCRMELPEMIVCDAGSVSLWGVWAEAQETPTRPELTSGFLSVLLPAAFCTVINVLQPEFYCLCIQCSSLKQSLCVISPNSALRWGTNPALLCLWYRVLQWWMGTSIRVWCSILLYPWFSACLGLLLLGSRMDLCNPNTAILSDFLATSTSAS